GCFKMSKSSSEWARRRRAKLLCQLGSKCAACGATDELQLDLVSAAGVQTHGNGRTGRICFYVRQWRMGNVRLLCADCNELKGARADAEFWAGLNTERESIESTTTIKVCEQLQQQRNALAPRELHS